MATIVFVEDDPSIQKLIRVTLRESPHTILMAADGAAGLDLIDHERPDAVFTDLAMPEMDGLALCRAIRARPELQDMPVILLTASVRRVELDEAWRSGATDHLIKPFTTAELRNKVAEHVG